MSSKLGTKPSDAEPLKAFKRALAAGEAAGIAVALRALVGKEPRRWRELLLIDGGLKDPHSDGFGARLQLVLEAGVVLLESDESAADGRKVVEMAAGATVFFQLFSSVRRHLDAAAFLLEPRDHQKVRLLAYTESQWLLALSESGRAALNAAGALDTYKLHSSAFEATTGAKFNMGAVIEGTIDCVELVLRFIQHTGSRSEPPAEASLPRSPYLDEDFLRVLVLAGRWREYQDAWTRFKFLGWGLRASAEEDGALVLAPDDVTDLVRYEVGVLRDGQNQIEFGLSTRSVRSRADAKEAQEQLVSSIMVPHVGDEWDGVLDVEAFSASVQASLEGPRTQLWIKLKHYSETVAALRVVGSLGPVTWEEWLGVMIALRELSHAFRAAFDSQVPDYGGDGSLRLAIVVRPRVLADALCAVLTLDHERCLAVIAALPFDANRKALEIYEQPLVPISDERLIFPPGLVSLGLPSRNVENILAQWDGAATNLRGAAFENAIRSIFDACPPAKTVSRVKFTSEDAREVEYDVVVAWGGYLLLVECKFVRGVHSPAEAWRAAGEIQHAIEQLTRQKGIALREWDVLRAAAPGLWLPAPAYPADRVIRLVVASVPHFTGRRENDLFVIDERCLARFFGNPNIAAMVMDQTGADREVGILDTVRTSTEFVVEEFIRHLEFPAPVNTFLRGLTVTQRRMRILEPQDPRILVSHVEFAAPDYSDKIEMYRSAIEIGRSANVVAVRAAASPFRPRCVARSRARCSPFLQAELSRGLPPGCLLAPFPDARRRYAGGAA